MPFDPLYLLLLAPTMMLAMWAQSRVKMNYAAAARIPSQLSGAAAARHVLDMAGLQDRPIEPIRGQLTDHYDPRTKVLRLSEGVYAQRNLAAVGIAAHEAGHAIQDARNYAPLVVRNLAVPAAKLGGNFSFFAIIIGAMIQSPWVVYAGIGLFGFAVFFQLINLPVEFDASRRAKQQLVEHGIISGQELPYVEKVLGAAAWTYVAATLQSVMTLLYFVLRFAGSGSRR